MTGIGSYAFENCVGLTRMEIPAGTASIGSYAFEGCNGLKSIEISDGVTNIGEYAFRGCDLTDVEIPDSVINIGSYAFRDCSELTSVKIGKGAAGIGCGAFSVCRSLESIIVAEENPAYHSRDNCLIETAGKVLISGCKTSRIPADGSVTGIGELAFSAAPDCRA